MEKKVWDKTLYINESCQKQLCTILSMFAIKNPLWFKKKIVSFYKLFFIYMTLLTKMYIGYILFFNDVHTL